MRSRPVRQRCRRGPRKCEVIFDVARRTEQLKELEAESTTPVFWNDQNKLGIVNRERKENAAGFGAARFPL